MMKSISTKFLCYLPIAALSLFGASIPESQASVFHTATDFSLASNPNGAWEYGSGTGGSSFTAFSSSTPALFGLPVLEAWTGAATWPFVAHNTSASTLFAFGWFVPTDFLDMHPGPAAVGSDAIVRWTAPATGSYSYVTDFQPLNGASGAVTQVFLNNSILNSVTLSTLTNFSGTLNLTLGDQLWFVVNNGGGFGGQSTGLRAVIESVDAVPEPSGLALLSSLTLLLAAIGLFSPRSAGLSWKSFSVRQVRGEGA